MIFKQKGLLVTLSAAMLGLLAYGGGGGDSSGGSNVSLSATIGGSYNVAYSPTLFDHIQEIFTGKRALAISSPANNEIRMMSETQY